jgi:2'-5' RNA ligase
VTGVSGSGLLQPGYYPAGQSALIVEVPEAEPLVAPWRRTYDQTAAAGIPAHLTVLVPFLDAGAQGRPGSVDERVMAELRALFAAHPAFALTFRTLRRFPDVLYLDPEPAEPLRALTTEVVERWPDTPPYGGQFTQIVPHLTVAHTQESDVLDAAEADVSAHLPLVAQATAVSLFASDGTRWQRRAVFPLSAS